MRKLIVLCKVNNGEPSGSLINQTLARLSLTAFSESACSCESYCTQPASVALIPCPLQTIRILLPTAGHVKSSFAASSLQAGLLVSS